MNLQAPSTISTPLYRLFPSPNFNYSLKFCRRTTSSELHSPVAGDSSPSVRTHRVTVHDRQRGLVHQFFVPEDQYILHTAESQNISLPFACRHGCCTSCAVRIKSGQIRQPEALGISAELKSKDMTYGEYTQGVPSARSFRLSGIWGRVDVRNLTLQMERLFP
ncbi:hypothetical protein CsSME_00049827 [Camellia sinensis var. sinensis]